MVQLYLEQMIKQGLVEETRALRDRGVFKTSGTAAAAIGYKELLPYLDGTCTLEEAVADLKQATRRYAKRQITWFSAKSYVTPILADRAGMMRNFEEIVNNAMDIVTARA